MLILPSLRINYDEFGCLIDPSLNIDKEISFRNFSRTIRVHEISFGWKTNIIYFFFFLE